METLKQITRYLRGELTEAEAIEFWVKLLKKPEDLKLLEFYLLLKSYFSSTSEKYSD